MAQASRSWSSFALVRLNAFSFGVTGFILAMDTVILPVFILTVAPEGYKNSYLTVLGISGLLIAALMQPIIGRMSDRTRSFLGKRVPYLLWGTVFACAGLAGVRLAPNFAVLFGVWVFIQCNLNVAYGPGLALLRDLVPLNRIGVASAIKILADSLGGVALIAVSGALIGIEAASGTIDWVWIALAILGASLVLSMVVTSATVLAREGPLPRPAVRDDGARRVPVMDRDLVLFLVSRMLMFTAITAFQTYGLFFLHDVVGLADPAQALGRMILAIGGALAVAVYIAGWASDRVGRKPVVLVGAAGAALSTLWMLTAGSATEVLIIGSVIGASVGTLASANWAMANELGSQQNAGLHIGIVNMATIGGAAVAKLLGPAIDLLNRVSTNFGYEVLIASCAGMFVAGALILVPVKTTVREESLPGAPPLPPIDPPEAGPPVPGP